MRASHILWTLVLAVLIHPSAGARGSRLDHSLPVTVITREELAQSPLLSLDKLPVNLNVMGTPGKSVTLRGLTDSTGAVPIATVPPMQWLPEDAIKGVSVILPSDALVSVYGQDSVGGVVNFISRQAYGLKDGQLVSPEKWARDKLEPFSLLCRSDEGLPTRLFNGEALSYRVPGDKSDLDGVLKATYVYEPKAYALPDGQGFNVTSLAGPDPGRTWRSLEGLSQRGLIANLEWDPCWKFLPESAQGGGCMPADKDFPDKAVHYSGLDLSGSLKASYSNKALAGAWLMYEPLTPTPYFDPGDRPGDDQPPQIVRTGADGAFLAPLNGLAGPLQVGVAQGCEEHTTVVVANDPQGTISRASLGITTGAPVAGGAGPTTARPLPGVAGAPPVETPSPPRSTPRKPLAGEMVCGPDVTDYVLKVLKLMQDHYNLWDYGTKTKQCLVLFSPIHFQAAWDMQLFAPSDGGEPEGKPGYMEHIFFQRAAPGYCAVPRWPCGPTVKFLGYCVNAQVVNYVQWGLMNQLCENQGVGMLSHLLRSGSGSYYTGQEAMAAIGQAFGSTDRDMSYRKALMKRYLDFKVSNDQNGWYAMEGAQCAMTCDEVVTGADKWLEAADWGYQWGPGSGDSVRTLRQERQQEELKQLELKRKREGRR